MTSFEDPKTTIMKMLKDHFIVTKDNDTTPAASLISLEFPEEELPRRFEKADVILTVGRDDETSNPLGGVKSLKKYVGLYRCGVWTKDKTGIGGETVCKKAIQKIKDIINDHAIAPGGNLSTIVKVNTKDDDRQGSPTLFHRIVILRTVHYGQETL